MTRYHKRDIIGTVADALADMPVVVVTGMRQVGKSTLLLEEAALKGRRYYNLDDFAHLEMARNSPESMLEGNQPVTIDEIQRCPELLLSIKTAVDRERIPGRFLLSGSANLLLLKGVSETLAGRAVYLTLHPFSRREISETVDRAPFLIEFMDQPHALPGFPTALAPVTPAEIILGGFPTLCLDKPRNPGLWLKGYEQTYLERDLRELSQVGDLLSFRRLTRLAALRTANVLNLSQVGRDAQLTSATATRHLNLLETSFVTWRLPPYLANRASRLIKSPKLFFADSGLAGYLAGIENESTLLSHPAYGSLMETYVIGNLRATIEAWSPSANLFFWNIQGRHEVDLLVEKSGEVFAFEIKAGSRWTPHDTNSLKVFVERTPECKAAVLAHNGNTTVALGPKLWAIPLALLLS